MVIDPDVLKLSRVVGTEDFLIGHFVSETLTKQEKVLNFKQIADIFIPSKSLFIEFASLIALSFFVGLLILFLVNRQNLKPNITVRTYWLNFFHFNDTLLKKPFSPLGILLLFKIFNLFLTKQFLSSNIKTSKGRSNFEIKQKINLIELSYFFSY